LVKGETIEQCLANYSEQASELESLLQTALAAKSASAIQPRPEFKARARYQFRSALREAVTRRRPRFFSWQPRWATAVAIVLILLLAGGGTAAAGNSMPDELLYPTKLATEQIRLKLTPSDLGKAQLYASFADKRVLEIACMAEEGKPELVERTAQRLDTYLAMIAHLVSVQEEEPEVMMAPPAPAPPPARAPGPPEQAGGKPAQAKEINNRRAKLRAAIAYYAIQNPMALRAALNKTPESAKPALRRAIAISIAGYERALKAVGE
jgi:hypothetical protein